MPPSSLDAPVARVPDNLADVRLLTTAHVAAVLGVSQSILRTWRTRRCGPSFLRFGAGTRAKVAYRESDLVAFLAASLHVVERLPKPGPGRMPKRPEAT